MQWVFPEDKSSTVPGAMQAERPSVASPLVLVDGGALACGWILSGRRDSLPRAFSQHDHLCEGQENLDLEACFIYSFLIAALL